MMPRQPNHHGGGAQTNANGLQFERTTDLSTALQSKGYDILIEYDNRNKEVGFLVSKDGVNCGFSAPKHCLYRYLLRRNINYKDFNSVKWLPDEAFINFQTNTVYIIEKKFQNGSGSVDEKLQGCEFKKNEYEKLFRTINYKVEYIYVLSDWFNEEKEEKAKKYKDVLEYIKSVGCKYFFTELPLSELGL